MPGKRNLAQKRSEGSHIQAIRMHSQRFPGTIFQLFCLRGQFFCRALNLLCATSTIVQLFCLGGHFSCRALSLLNVCKQSNSTCLLSRLPHAAYAYMHSFLAGECTVSVLERERKQKKYSPEKRIAQPRPQTCRLHLRFTVI